MKYHVHQKIGEEIKAISGYFKVLEEGKLPFKDREVLYYVEMGHADTSCCGPGSAYGIRVPGYLIKYKSAEDISGLPVSEVEPVIDKVDQEAIKKLLLQKYPSFTPVDFT